MRKRGNLEKPKDCWSWGPRVSEEGRNAGPSGEREAEVSGQTPDSLGSQGCSGWELAVVSP